MAKIKPPGFTVYEKDFPGYTVRLAIDARQRRADPETAGFRLSDDQDGPVYDVLRRQPDGTVQHGGKEWTPQDKDALIAKAKKAALGRKAFEFAEAHKRLLLEGRVPEHVAEFRLTVCTGRTADGLLVGGACPQYVGENSVRGSGHCQGCGCPNWDIAEMNRPGHVGLPGKAWYPMG